jgi:hypothetical protein
MRVRVDKSWQKRNIAKFGYFAAFCFPANRNDLLAFDRHDAVVDRRPINRVHDASLK